MYRVVIVCSFLALAACGGKQDNLNRTASLLGSAEPGALVQHSGNDGVYVFDFSAYPAYIRPKLLAEGAEKVACLGTARGGSQTIAACDRLQTIHDELETKGWCRGPDSAQPANRHWMNCGPRATPDS
jgi:hypothetical protein